jgi:hypothetical protein
VPEVPVSVMVGVPAAAFEAAVNVRLCAVPGVSLGADGLAVTPDDNPDTERFTLPVKPFRALAVTEVGCPPPPTVRVRLAGVTDSEKSGAGAAAVIVRAMVAVWVRLPDVPVSVIVAVPALALVPAVRVRF